MKITKESLKVFATRSSFVRYLLDNIVESLNRDGVILATDHRFVLTNKTVDDIYLSYGNGVRFDDVVDKNDGYLIVKSGDYAFAYGFECSFIKNSGYNVYPVEIDFDGTLFALRVIEEKSILYYKAITWEKE